MRRCRLLQPRRAALALAEPRNAVPRLFCVIAQRSGTRSRGIKLRRDLLRSIAESSAPLSPNSSP